MDDATRKQVIEALAEMIYETTHLSPLEDDGSHKCVISKDTLAAAREALTALKAIQPRPDVVVAARKFVRRLEKFSDQRAGFMLENFGEPLEAALADEQEWEVRYAICLPGERLEDMDTLLLCSPENKFARTVYIPKAKPQPVSREKAIEDAAKHAREILSELLSEWGAVAHDDMRDCAAEIDAALSREVQP